MSAGVAVTAKKWGKRLLIGAAVLWVVWFLIAAPWTTFGLWKEAKEHEDLFRRTAEEELKGRSLDDTPNERAVHNLGYYWIDMEDGVVMFYRFRRFRGKGILGLAYARGTIPDSVNQWAHLMDAPPYLFWLRMPENMYIFAGR